MVLHPNVYVRTRRVHGGLVAEGIDEGRARTESGRSGLGGPVGPEEGRPQGVEFMHHPATLGRFENSVTTLGRRDGQADRTFEYRRTVARLGQGQGLEIPGEAGIEVHRESLGAQRIVVVERVDHPNVSLAPFEEKASGTPFRVDEPDHVGLRCDHGHRGVDTVLLQMSGLDRIGEASAEDAVLGDGISPQLDRPFEDAGVVARLGEDHGLVVDGRNRLNRHGVDLGGIVLNRCFHPQIGDHIHGIGAHHLTVLVDPMQTRAFGPDGLGPNVEVVVGRRNLLRRVRGRRSRGGIDDSGTGVARTGELERPFEDGRSGTGLGQGHTLRIPTVEARNVHLDGVDHVEVNVPRGVEDPQPSLPTAQEHGRWSTVFFDEIEARVLREGGGLGGGVAQAVHVRDDELAAEVEVEEAVFLIEDGFQHQLDGTAEDACGWPGLDQRQGFTIAQIGRVDHDLGGVPDADLVDAVVFHLHIDRICLGVGLHGIAVGVLEEDLGAAGHGLALGSRKAVHIGGREAVEGMGRPRILGGLQGSVTGEGGIEGEGDDAFEDAGIFSGLGQGEGLEIPRQRRGHVHGHTLILVVEQIGLRRDHPNAHLAALEDHVVTDILAIQEAGHAGEVGSIGLGETATVEIQVARHDVLARGEECEVVAFENAGVETGLRETEAEARPRSEAALVDLHRHHIHGDGIVGEMVDHPDVENLRGGKRRALESGTVDEEGLRSFEICGRHSNGGTQGQGIADERRAGVRRRIQDTWGRSPVRIEGNGTLEDV